MTKSARPILLLFMFSLLPLSANSSEYMLFSPRPLEGEILMPERGKGVLVQRITIKQGDTLSQISRDFSGKGSYYPQILLFNDIANPDRIFTGKELMVPITKQEALSKNASQRENIAKPVKKESAPKPAPREITSGGKPVPAEKNIRSTANKPLPKKPLPGSKQLAKKGEQASYDKAMSAFSGGAYEKALTLFSRFLDRYPSSTMASEASLYKAECLLKLSGK